MVYLYTLGISLPKNSTELYHHFICSTIYRHLFKLNPHTCKITDLTNLPEPYNRIIKQLSKLSLKALDDNKLIFSLDEITEVCPDLVAVPGAINGFGLLQAVQHFGLHAKMVTLNFLHFTIQEFLAAHYLSHLLPDEELAVIEANFWNSNYFNMFSMYVSLTKGQQPSFRKFLSGGNETITIADQFLKDQLKCLRLYRCFNEAGDNTMCNTIERAEIFKPREIRLAHNPLAASDMECISLFFTSPFNKEWDWLNLWGCYIQDKGLNVLYRGLCHCGDVTINQLGLDKNGLTKQSSSLISELTAKCKVKVLVISANYTIGEDQKLYSMLNNPSSILEELNMYNTKLSSRGAIALFTALKNNNKLKKLYIDNNDITDYACNSITTALERNSCLVTLGMCRNKLSSDAIINIVQCLKVNNTLQLLGLPDCSQDAQQNIISLQEVFNKGESRGPQVKLEIKFSLV